MPLKRARKDETPAATEVSMKAESLVSPHFRIHSILPLGHPQELEPCDEEHPSVLKEVDYCEALAEQDSEMGKEE